MKYSHQALIGVVIVSTVIIYFYVRAHRRKKQLSAEKMN
jgi:hypothetical protein